jgi:WD40 repeat protein
MSDTLQIKSVSPTVATPKFTSMPFRGTLPYSEADAAVFRGRENEAALLADLVQARSEVVLLGPPGRGKTSLVLAGLLPRLRQRGCRVLPLARVGGPLPLRGQDSGTRKAMCYFAFHAAVSWSPSGTNLRRLEDVSIMEVLKEHRWDRRGRPTPLIAIFDYFDDFFILHPKRDSHRERFFDQMREALAADPLLRVLFVVRDQYLPALLKFAAVLPERAQAQLRLERLTALAVQDIISATFQQASWKADSAAVFRLAGFLADNPDNTLAVEDTSLQATVTAPRVEPLMLQLACRRLCTHVAKTGRQLSLEAAVQFSKERKNWTVETYLEELYEEEIQRFTAGNPAAAATIREHLGAALVSRPADSGYPWRAGPASDSNFEQSAASETAARLLQDLAKMDPPFIVRENSLGANGSSSSPGPVAYWYEFTHHLLGPAVQSANAKWEKLQEGEVDGRRVGQEEGRREPSQRLLEKLQLRQRAARLAEGDLSAQLGEQELAVAENWRDCPETRQSGLLTPAIELLIDRSRTRWNNEKIKRLNQQAKLRNIAILVLGSLLLTAVLLVVALVFAVRQAEKLKKLADLATTLTENRRIVHDHQYSIYDAMQAVETDPTKHVSQAVEIYEQTKKQSDEFSKTVRPKDETPQLQELRLALQKDNQTALDDAVEYLNVALQGDRTHTILGPAKGEKYEVNGVAIGGATIPLIAAACQDGKVRLWTLDGESIHPPLEVPNGAKRRNVAAVAFGGPNRLWLAAACQEAGVFVWALDETGKALGECQSLTRPGTLVSWNGITWSPSQPDVVVASAERTDDDKFVLNGGCVQSWRVEARTRTKDTLLLPFNNPRQSDEATAVTFTSDGQLIAALKTGKLITWKMDNSKWVSTNLLKQDSTEGKKELAEAPGFARINHLAAGSVQFLKDDGKERLFTQILATAGEDGTVQVWDLGAGKLLSLIRHTTPVRGVAISAHDDDRAQFNILATACRDAKIRLWGLPRHHIPGRQRVDWPVDAHNYLTLSGHTSKMTGVVFGQRTANGRSEPILLSTSDDNTARVWDLLPKHGPAARGDLIHFSHFVLSRDLTRIAGCERRSEQTKSRVRIRELQPDESPFDGFSTSDDTRRVAFHPDNRHLATIDAAGSFHLWSSLHKESGASVQLPVAGKLKNDELLPPPFGHIAFSSTGRLAVFSISKNALGICELFPGKDGSLRAELLREVTKHDLLPYLGQQEPTVYDFALHESKKDNKRRLALACAQGRVLVFEIGSSAGWELRLTHNLRVPGEGTDGDPSANAVTFSRDANYIAVGYSDARIRIWDLGAGDGSPRLTIPEKNPKGENMRGHTSEVRRLCFNPMKDDELASGGDEGFVCVWQLSSSLQEAPAQPRNRFELHAAIQALRYDPTGTRLGTATSTGQARVYWLDSEELQSIANDRVKQLQLLAR